MYGVLFLIQTVINGDIYHTLSAVLSPVLYPKLKYRYKSRPRTRRRQTTAETQHVRCLHPQVRLKEKVQVEVSFLRHILIKCDQFFFSKNDLHTLF